MSFITFNNKVKVYFGNEKKSKSHQKQMTKCIWPDGATAWRDAVQKAIELPSGDGTEKMTKYIVALTGIAP